MIDLEARKKGIGSSDAPAVIGISEYRTRLDVYLDKVDEAPPVEDNDAMFWGRTLEEVIANVYAERTGHKIRRRGQVTSKDHKWMQANLDRLIVGDPRGVGALEIKTAGSYMAGEWGEAGTDQVPPAVYAQVAHQLGVTGYTWARVAVLIGGRDFRIYDIPRDEDVINSLIEIERQFWIEHVEARVPPEPQTKADIDKRWPIDNGELAFATAEIQDAVDRLNTVKTRIGVLSFEKEALENDVKKSMREASQLIGLDGQTLATWKTQESKRLDEKAVKAALGDELHVYQTITKSRVLRIK